MFIKFRPSISFNVPSHLCHILLLPLYILFQFFISLSTSLYMKCDSLTIGIGPCNPARAYVFFDISSASRSVFTDVFIFHFKTFFFKHRKRRNIKRQKIEFFMGHINRSIYYTIIVSYKSFKLSKCKAFFPSSLIGWKKQFRIQRQKIC